MDRREPHKRLFGKVHTEMHRHGKVGQIMETNRMEDQTQPGGAEILGEVWGRSDLWVKEVLFELHLSC